MKKRHKSDPGISDPGFAVLESIPKLSAIVDRDYRVVHCNALFAAELGKSPQACIGENFFDLVTENEDPELLQYGKLQCQEAFRTGANSTFEKRYGEVTFRYLTNPIKSPDGVTTHLRLSRENITPTRTGQWEASISAARSNLALELSKVGVWELDLISGKCKWSDIIWEMFALDKAQHTAAIELWKNIIHPSDRNDALEHFRSTLNQGKELKMEFRIELHNGDIRWCLIKGQPLPDNNSSYIGIILDITERKLAEIELAKQRKHMEFALEQSQIGVWDLNLSNSLVQHTSMVSRIFGYPDTTIPGWCLDLFLSHVINEDRERIETLLKNSLQQEQAYAFECRIRGKDGVIRWIASKGSFYHDKVVNESHVLGVVANVTERKKAEEEQQLLQEQLMHSQKLELVGQLAGGVAHDFNNHLTTILGNIELVLYDIDPSLPFVENLKDIQQAARRSSELTQQILGFARKQPANPKPLMLDQTVGNLLPFVFRLAGTHISYSWRPGTASMLVMIDPSQLDQILTNLCVNAQHAITGTGQVVVKTGTIQINGKNCARYNLCHKHGQYLWIRVTDNGSGIDAKTLPHIFEPFFTTKELGKGTGLGLSTVYGIVKQNGGSIECKSSPGKGTSFTVYLPQHTNGGDAGNVAAHPVKTESRQTILLVDDEVEVLNLVKRILQKNSYNVITARDAENAIELFSASPGVIDLLMTDVRLPGMNGIELNRSLKAMRPELKTLFMTGYALQMFDTRKPEDAEINLITKPFMIKDVLDAVRRSLQSPPSAVMTGR